MVFLRWLRVRCGNVYPTELAPDVSLDTRRDRALPTSIVTHAVTSFFPPGVYRHGFSYHVLDVMFLCSRMDVINTYSVSVCTLHSTFFADLATNNFLFTFVRTCRTFSIFRLISFETVADWFLMSKL